MTARVAQTPLVTESVQKSFHTTYIKLILFRLIKTDVCFGFSDIDIPVLELESGQHYKDSAVFSAAMKWRYHHVTVWIISIITAEAVVILLLFTALPLKPWLKSSQILNHINVMRSVQQEFTHPIDLTIIFVNSISMTHPLQKTVKTS